MHTKHDKEEPVALVTMKQHPFVMVVVVLIGDLLLSVGVAFPQLLVHHLLDLRGMIQITIHSLSTEV